MGLIFGKITVETPKYDLLKSTPDYEIRKYPPHVIAEVTYSPSEMNGKNDAGFTILANYIGAFGTPHNSKPEKIAMTAPVITTRTSPEKIPMTAPVVTSGCGGEKVTMRFVLPQKFRTAEEAPRPVGERVVVRAEEERKVAVVRFSGVATEEVVREKAERLKEVVERDGFKVVGEWLLARYNPPWTVPMCRTNEVMIPVE